MKFAFILAERATWSIVFMCAVLKVSASGFYAWLKRPPSAHDQKDERLKVLVAASFDQSRKTYGSPRVPIAPNLLNREFEAAAPNQRWVGDATELLTTTGRFFLAVMVDLYARFVVGWAMSTINDRHLTMAALAAALKRRRPDIGLLHHSDRGSTYTCEDYRQLLAEHGIVCSMSRTGNCYDNAAMESWNSTFKFELGDTFESVRHGKDLAFDYIEVFYNQRRRHSSIGYVSPAEHERRFYQNRNAMEVAALNVV